MQEPYTLACAYCGHVVRSLKWIFESGLHEHPELKEDIPIEALRVGVPTTDKEALNAILSWFNGHVRCRCGATDWELVPWSEAFNVKRLKLKFTTIRVDEQVKRALEAMKVVGRDDSINKVLRRLLGLDR